MQLNKTDKARDALAASAGSALNMAQRRILILTDGRRSIEDIMAMLGPQILGDIDRLLRDGYLAATDRGATREGGPGLGQRLRDIAGRVARPAAGAAPATAPAPVAAQAATQAMPPSPAPAPTPAPAPARAPGTRRSLAASKMYVLDLLQTQRDLQMAECRSEIQCAQDEAATIVALLDGVRQLMPRVSPGMSTRILARLDEVLPEPYLPALRALEAEITHRPVLAVDNVA